MIPNVKDKFQTWPQDLIKQAVAAQTLPYAVCMENWVGDFNQGTLIRNANGFGAKEVFYLASKKRWDRRGAVGTQNYTSVNYLAELPVDLREKYPHWIGVENNVEVETQTLHGFVWPQNCLVFFGAEGQGLTPELLQQMDAVVEIPMLGSVRSFNAGVASGIVMYEIAKTWNL